MTDRADEIAREIARAHLADDRFIGDLAAEIAAALRSYGNERLEEAAYALDRGGPNLNDDWSNWGAAEFVRSLKSQRE